MRFRVSAPLIALLTVFLASPLHAADVAGALEGDTQANAGICATRDLSPDEHLAVRSEVTNRLSEGGELLAVGGNIQIAWHVIHDGVTGDIPQSMIDATIAELNLAYRGGENPGIAFDTGYTFSLASVDRTDNATWFLMAIGSSAERNAKRTLALDVPHRLNIYSTRSPSGNWATFPSSWTERDSRHGVVLHYGYLAGSYIVPLNTGDLAVHEVGHYLGLYHTFQGACRSPGDEVDDTPYENGGATCCPCPISRDTCPSSPGLDPIQNYMAYTGDACKTEFTAGQDARMDILVPAYRPSLLNAARSLGRPVVGLAPSARIGDDSPVSGFEFLGATPNPSYGSIDVHFAIPASGDVEFRLYDLTGRAVSAAMHASYAAGIHAVSWSAADAAGRSLAPGVYFLRMQTGEFSATQRIVLAR